MTAAACTYEEFHARFAPQPIIPSTWDELIELTQHAVRLLDEDTRPAARVSMAAEEKACVLPAMKQLRTCVAAAIKASGFTIASGCLLYMSQSIVRAYLATRDRSRYGVDRAARSILSFWRNTGAVQPEAEDPATVFAEPDRNAASQPNTVAALPEIPKCDRNAASQPDTVAAPLEVSQSDRSDASQPAEPVNSGEADAGKEQLDLERWISEHGAALRRRGEGVSPGHRVNGVEGSWWVGFMILEEPP
jgi:hypothetical protein